MKAKNTVSLMFSNFSARKKSPNTRGSDDNAAFCPTYRTEKLEIILGESRSTTAEIKERVLFNFITERQKKIIEKGRENIKDITERESAAEEEN